jgi:hypothetical protein
MKLRFSGPIQTDTRTSTIAATMLRRLRLASSRIPGGGPKGCWNAGCAHANQAAAVTAATPATTSSQDSHLGHGSRIITSSRWLACTVAPSRPTSAAASSPGCTAHSASRLAAPRARWRNLYRDTDPIGGPVFTQEDELDGGDRCLRDPVTSRYVAAEPMRPVLGHSGYMKDPAMRDHVTTLAGRLRAEADPGRD